MSYLSKYTDTKKFKWLYRRLYSKYLYLSETIALKYLKIIENNALVINEILNTIEVYNSIIICTLFLGFSAVNCDEVATFKTWYATEYLYSNTRVLGTSLSAAVCTLYMRDDNKNINILQKINCTVNLAIPKCNYLQGVQRKPLVSWNSFGNQLRQTKPTKPHAWQLFAERVIIKTKWIINRTNTHLICFKRTIWEGNYKRDTTKIFLTT